MLASQRYRLTLHLIDLFPPAPLSAPQTIFLRTSYWLSICVPCALKGKCIAASVEDSGSSTCFPSLAFSPGAAVFAGLVSVSQTAVRNASMFVRTVHPPARRLAATNFDAHRPARTSVVLHSFRSHDAFAHHSRWLRHVSFRENLLCPEPFRSCAVSCSAQT